MKIIINTLKTTLVINISVILAILIVGCGSDVNPDFIGHSKHPFEEGTHSDYISDNNWYMSSCFSCHTNPDTPQIEKTAGSCSSTDCHSAAGDNPGPFACNTCHGDFYADPTIHMNWAPPRGLEGSSDRVGAHQVHLNPSAEYRPVSCNECHKVPNHVNAHGHIDDDTPKRADVRFWGVASARRASPSYSPEDMSCSSTYCHGSGTSLSWVSTESISCGDCHSIPPDIRSHQGMQTNQCVNCHSSVVDGDLNIINPNLHVNGRVDFGN